MFNTSLSLFLGYCFFYVIVPLIPGIITVWLLGAKHLRGVLFCVISWFLGVGVVGYGMFLLQFARYGIDIIAYSILLIVLIVLLAVKYFFLEDRISFKDMKKSLTFEKVQIVWKDKSTSYKWIVAILMVFILVFLGISLYFTSHFPSYADDSFGNWHVAVIHMIYDGGIKIFGEASQVLARGRLGYPIMIGTFQSLIGIIMGGYNDIYVNLFQWMSVFFFLIFVVSFSYKYSKNILYSLIGPACIISLPLVFYHTTQGYMDLLSGIYAALALMFFYSSLEDAHQNRTADILIGFVLLAILSYIKNDGAVVYAPSVLIGYAGYILLYKKWHMIKKVLIKPLFWIILAIIVLYFIAPFTFLKFYYDFSFNPTAEGPTLSSAFHREIFSVIWKITRSMNNYGFAPHLTLIATIYSIYYYFRTNTKKLYLIVVPILCIILFTLVFLLTENYKYVLDQTTVNRVYTVSFVILFSILPILIHDGE